MIGLLWALNPNSVHEIYDMILARAVGLKENDAPILPVLAYFPLLCLIHLGGFTLFTFVELPALAWLTHVP